MHDTQIFCGLVSRPLHRHSVKERFRLARIGVGAIRLCSMLHSNRKFVGSPAYYGNDLANAVLGSLM